MGDASPRADHPRAAALPGLPTLIETPRLVIRAPRAGDGDAVYEAVCETLADLRAWPASLPWALARPSPEASESFCRQGAAAWQARSDFPMLLFLKDAGDYAGSSGLHRVDWSVPSVEVGFWCRKRYQGLGLITEAVAAVVSFACHRLGARRVTCLPDARNVASRRVAERAGFTLEGIMRHERAAPDGEPRDTCLYAIVP